MLLWGLIWKTKQNKQWRWEKQQQQQKKEVVNIKGLPWMGFSMAPPTIGGTSHKCLNLPMVVGEKSDCCL